VTSDLLRDIEGLLTVSVNDHGNKLFEHKVKVQQKANENKKYEVKGLRECLLNVDKQQVSVTLELTEGDTVIAKRFVIFSQNL
jgi:hypothetical protein